MKNFVLTVFAALMAFTIIAQPSVPDNWFNLDPAVDGINGVSTEEAYKNILKDKKSSTVVVAVIDSGVDPDHEDLKDVMWVNNDEIAGNGIDDDRNGYVDDVHGWNFIGGPDGRNVNDDNLELTRLYRKYMKEYADVQNPANLDKSGKEEYAYYLDLKKKYENNRENAKKQVENIERQKENILKQVNTVNDALAGKAFTLENVEALPEDDKSLIDAKRVVTSILNQVEASSYQEMIDLIDQQFAGAADYYGAQYNAWYNVDFDPRDIVGDDYDNPYDRDYGNNDVMGPDASHGTHVAGIIAANRENGLGMKGVADNVRIMSVRAVPNGDERDKDVANAIRYAVDNGAHIINMSFGKSFSWNKQVVDDAVKYAQAHDVLLVHAAGNDGKDNDATDNYPNDQYLKHFFLSSGESKTWLEVGALSYKKGEDMAASFSNYGQESVDLFAPGVAIYSTTPDNGYASFQGTSMASPVVAGAAAVLRSYFPELSAKQVKEIIMDSIMEQDETVKKPGSDEKVPFNELCVTGGVVNVLKAVEAAENVKKGKRAKILKKANKKGNKIYKGKTDGGKEKSGSA